MSEMLHFYISYHYFDNEFDVDEDKAFPTYEAMAAYVALLRRTGAYDILVYDKQTGEKVSWL